MIHEYCDERVDWVTIAVLFSKLLVTTRKKLKTTGIDRTPGGTPITTTSHYAPLKDIDIKQTK